MAQKIEFTNEGLNLGSIGAKINDLNSLWLKKLELHSNRNNFRIWFEEDFNYYFLDSDSMFMPNVGLIKELFIVPDKFNSVIGIFIFIENPTSELENKLNEAFDMPKLKSDSSNYGGNYRSHTFWNKNNISIFLSKSKSSKYTKISITKISTEERSPGINID